MKIRMMLITVVLLIAMCSLASAQTYSDILDQWYTALSCRMDYGTMENMGLPGIAANISSMPLYSVGYQFTDLDQDGSYELIVASMTDDSYYGCMVFALYTDQNGQAVSLIHAGDRNRYYSLGDNRFANVGSSGAYDSVDTTLLYQYGALYDLNYSTSPAYYDHPTLIPMSQWGGSRPTISPVTPTPVPAYTGWHINGITSDRVHLRAGAGTNYPSLGLYFTGADVDLLTSQSNGWSYVRIGSETGYVMTRYLDSTPSYTRLPTGICRGNGYVNLRSSPNQNAGVLEKIYSGASVSILGETNTYWYYVMAPDGTRGYVLASLVSASF